MRNFLLGAVAIAASAAMGENAGEGLVRESPYKDWHLTIGPVMSPRVRVSVSGPRVFVPKMPQGGMSQSSRSSGRGGDAPADPSAGYVNRQYVDGYVKPDEGTEDPNSMIAGLTWDWGADNVSAQHKNGRMEFHTGMTRWEESVSSSSSSYGISSGSSSESDRDLLVGVEAMGGWTFFNNGTFDATVDAGFRFYGSGYLEADSESKYGYRTSVTTTRREYQLVDSYDASGWTEDIPVGAYTGTAGGPGRLLGAAPTRHEELMDSSTETVESEEYYSYQSNTKLIYRIWDLRLGPTFGWQATDYLVIRGGVYGLLGLVDATLKTDGGYLGGASASTCGAVFGMAFGASAQLYLTETLFLYGGAEYDWWTDSVDLNAGGATADIKLSDLVISLGLGVEF